MLFTICDFHEDRRREGRTVVMAETKLHIRVYRETVWHFEGKQRLGKLGALRHGVRHLLFRDQLSYFSQYITQQMTSVIPHLWRTSTPTCFGTQLPPSRSHYNKGTPVKCQCMFHFFLYELLKSLNAKMHEVDKIDKLQGSDVEYQPLGYRIKSHL
jgi:hypothetical protein